MSLYKLHFDYNENHPACMFLPKKVFACIRVTGYLSYDLMKEDPKRHLKKELKKLFKLDPSKTNCKYSFVGSNGQFIWDIHIYDSEYSDYLLKTFSDILG